MLLCLYIERCHSCARYSNGSISGAAMDDKIEGEFTGQPLPEGAEEFDISGMIEYPDGKIEIQWKDRGA
jgi:hypothetical protein